QTLAGLRSGATRALADGALGGDVRAFGLLVRLLATERDARAAALAPLLPERVRPALGTPVATAGADTERDEAQAKAGPCPECGKARRALRVKKEGPNQGRLFLACSDRACDSFEWASARAAAAAPAAPAADPVLNLVRQAYTV